MTAVFSSPVVSMSDLNASSSSVHVAVIGGGVAGATAALHLAERGIKVSLIEQGGGLVNGPPICHLHAGGNLYPDISEQQCLDLLQQSIESVRLYRHTLNIRPTVIAVPHSDPTQPDALLPRLATIAQHYRDLVEQDEANRVLGDPDTYYRVYDKASLLSLRAQTQPETPTSFDEWMIPFAQHVDLEQLKFPVIMVNEFGWSVFRLAATAMLAFEQMPHCSVMLNTRLEHAEYNGQVWQLRCHNQQGEIVQLNADYLVNACGYETGKLDDRAGFQRDRWVEFKAAYVTEWADCQQQWPEVVVHGPRGTEHGMAQLTPYADHVFQLHGMTESITLFSDGLVHSTPESSQPTLPATLQQKIDSGWSNQASDARSCRAIEHIAQFIPVYTQAIPHGKPLYGAQQIPGEDATLRAADVTFEAQHYARLEIVKGSSALEAARKLVQHWALVPEEKQTSNDAESASIERQHPISMALSADEVEQRAIALAVQRGYPTALAKRMGEIPPTF